MSKYKLSDLPVNTTIEDSKQGKWTKEFQGVWCETDAHCVDCMDTIMEDPSNEELKKKYKLYNPMPEAASDHFQDWEVFAWPEASVAVLREAVDKLGTVTDILLGQKITVDEFMEFLAWKESKDGPARSDT